MTIARIQTAIYTNKKLAFLISILLASLIYFASINEPSSPYVSRRYGLGAGDTSGELASALRRKGEGRAAVAIIRVIGDLDNVQYLVQMKSHDYPIESFRGTVCLLGGNANKNDETPLDTLKRELNEELHNPEWVDAIDPMDVVDDSKVQLSDKPFYNNSTTLVPSHNELGITIRYLGTTLHFQSSQLINKPNPYAFMCALYEITLRPDQLPPSAIYPRGANIQEGRVVLLSEDQLVKHSKYAWGYEYTMEKYFGKKTVNQQRGTAVSDVDEKTWKDTIWTPAK
eukprot:CAMPEP_0172325174 /NCGR_PEP_ID=MMETSP1058-20130122/53296_1 /TAXON_ID=83371 /ORGANISM="Detonula confervacea, Strain CCMP 353" /LENGTH=283 /DNA_ID=CAMNT_0013041645 /DNA_START=64 /DNA_END=915 /DNA_ORIENTATION=-